MAVAEAVTAPASPASAKQRLTEDQPKDQPQPGLNPGAPRAGHCRERSLQSPCSRPAAFLSAASAYHPCSIKSAKQRRGELGPRILVPRPLLMGLSVDTLSALFNTDQWHGVLGRKSKGCEYEEGDTRCGVFVCARTPCVCCRLKCLSESSE